MAEKLRRKPGTPPLGTGLVDKAKQTLGGRGAQLQAQEQAAMGTHPPKRKTK